MTAIRLHHRTARQFRPSLSVCAVAFTLAAPATAQAQDQAQQFCVADPAAVTARAAITLPNTPLPEALADALDAAALGALDGAAAPGVIAGVITPEGIRFLCHRRLRQSERVNIAAPPLLLFNPPFGRSGTALRLLRGPRFVAGLAERRPHPLRANCHSTTL